MATNATVRQILAEWARIGQTKIVNVERIPGAPLTLQFTNVPESEVLDILLRSVTGYLAAPRPVAVANLSQYDRILVLPTAATPRVPVAGPTPVLQRPVVSQPAIDNDDDQPSIVQPPRGPLFPTFQLPQPGNPQPGGASATPGAIPPSQPPFGIDQQRSAIGGIPAPAVPVTGPSIGYPGGSVGTPRPGMVIQPPAQPGVFPPGQPQPLPPPDK